MDWHVIEYFVIGTATTSLENAENNEQLVPKPTFTFSLNNAPHYYAARACDGGHSPRGGRRMVRQSSQAGTIFARQLWWLTNSCKASDFVLKGAGH